MSRPGVEVRDAGPEDASRLLAMWHAANQRDQSPSDFVEDAGAALAQMAANPEQTLLLAESEGRLVGSVHLRRATLTPVHREQVVHTSFLVVLPEFRRQGVARLLLERAVEWAEEKDVANISAISASGARETHRWLARLGFTPIATVRLTTTSSLRRKVVGDWAGAPRIGRVLAQRRGMRRRQLD